jgi:hypothetical protein
MSKTFTQTVAELNGGKFAEELTTALSDLVGACSSIGKAGSLTVTIKMKPGKAGSAMQVEHDFTLKAPEFDRPTDYMYVGKDNSLLRNDPRQPDLPLVQSVDKETGEIRTAPPRTEAPLAASAVN